MKSKCRQYPLLVFVSILLLCGAASAVTLSLDDCIEQALKNNQNVIRARNNVKNADGAVLNSFGAFLPSVDVGGGYRKTITDEYNYFPPAEFIPYDTGLIGDTVIVDSLYALPTSEATGGGSSSSWSASISAGITLFNGGRNYYNYKGAKADKKYYDYTAEATEQDLIYQVKAQYFVYLKTLDQNKTAVEAVKRGEEQLKLAQSKYEVGSASKSDVLKAKVQYGNDRLSLISAENAVKVEHANLAYLIGLDVNSDVDFSSDYKPKSYDGTEMDAIKFGMAHHPGLLANDYNLMAAKYDVRSTRGRYFPTWTLNVSRGWSNPTWSGLTKFSSEDASWSISSSISLPLFENFSHKRDIIRSKATYNNAKADYFYRKNQVALDIKEAFLYINRSNQALQVARDNVNAAAEDMSLVQEKYNLGAATILELLDAQVSLITAENSEIEAVFDYNLAVAKLENAIGVR